MKEAVKRFLTGIKAFDSVTVLAFNDRAYVVSKRNEDPAGRLRSIDALKAFGGTSLYDAILQGLDLIGRGISRKAVIVFTDGDDRNSLAAVNPVEKKILETEATLYIITLGKGAQAANVRKVVDRLSIISGGRTFSIDKIDEFESQLRVITEDLSNQYLLGYSPTNSKHDGTYRKISVSTTENSHQVRARAGYRAVD
jgi:VWFA-related protein